MQVVTHLIFAVLTALAAQERGRNAIGWFVVGFFLPCIGLILVLVLPDLAVEREKEFRTERQTRRLREQLQQERMKSEAFRNYATHRLDVHDQELKIDSHTPAAGGSLPPVPPASASLPAAAKVPELPLENWFLAVAGGQPDGPYPLETVKARLSDRELGSNLLVWHETMEDWAPVEDTPLRRYL